MPIWRGFQPAPPGDMDFWKNCYMKYRSSYRFTAAVLVALFVFAPLLNAQSVPPPQETVDRKLIPDFLHSQGTIWTSPSRIRREDMKWLLPLAGTTALLIAKDSQISHRFDNSPDLMKASKVVSQLGTAYAGLGAGGALLGLGKVFHKDHLAEVGSRALRAGIYTNVAVQGLKLATQRMRPYRGANGEFWNGGNSFPSGHAAQAWALAAVVADGYPDKPLVKFGMYSFATAVSLSRITGQRHYPSDVLIGSVVGYLIGKYVFRH